MAASVGFSDVSFIKETTPMGVQLPHSGVYVTKKSMLQLNPLFSIIEIN